MFFSSAALHFSKAASLLRLYNRGCDQISVQTVIKCPRNCFLVILDCLLDMLSLYLYSMKILESWLLSFVKLIDLLFLTVKTAVDFEFSYKILWIRLVRHVSFWVNHLLTLSKLRQYLWASLIYFSKENIHCLMQLCLRLSVQMLWSIMKDVIYGFLIIRKRITQNLTKLWHWYYRRVCCVYAVQC